MKKYIALVLLMIANMTLAETYVCQTLEGDQTVTFGFVKELPLEDGWDQVSQFKLSIQTTELPFPSHVEYGTAREGDVWFTYTSDSTEIEFGMYLDEDEPVSFTLKGKKYTFKDCRYYEFNQQ